LNYLPNEDAVLYFAREILPLLVSSGKEIEFRVAGIKTPKSIQILSGQPGITIVGTVKDVAPEYARARMMVVPLRAGSGTRIKILEAFAFGVPVVSTSVGAAGLYVEHGVHLLIADTAEEFATACLRLLEDDTLAETLARNGYARLRAYHSLDHARDILHSVFPSRGVLVAPTRRAHAIWRSDALDGD
jgi:glycosyltransferase involved in cell wall biosynthesis